MVLHNEMALTACRQSSQVISSTDVTNNSTQYEQQSFSNPTRQAYYLSNETEIEHESAAKGQTCLMSVIQSRYMHQFRPNRSPVLFVRMSRGIELHFSPVLPAILCIIPILPFPFNIAKNILALSVNKLINCVHYTFFRNPF